MGRNLKRRRYFSVAQLLVKEKKKSLTRSLVYDIIRSRLKFKELKMIKNLNYRKKELEKIFQNQKDGIDCFDYSAELIREWDDAGLINSAETLELYEYIGDLEYRS